MQSQFWPLQKKRGSPGFESRFGRDRGFGIPEIPIWPGSRGRIRRDALASGNLNSTGIMISGSGPYKPINTPHSGLSHSHQNHTRPGPGHGRPCQWPRPPAGDWPSATCTPLSAQRACLDRSDDSDPDIKGPSREATWHTVTTFGSAGLGNRWAPAEKGPAVATRTSIRNARVLSSLARCGGAVARLHSWCLTSSSAKVCCLGTGR